MQNSALYRAPGSVFSPLQRSPSRVSDSPRGFSFAGLRRCSSWKMCTLQWVIRKSEIGPERAPLSGKEHIIAEKEWKKPPPRRAEEYIRENLSFLSTIKHRND